MYWTKAKRSARYTTIWASFYNKIRTLNQTLSIFKLVFSFPADAMSGRQSGAVDWSPLTCGCEDIWIFLSLKIPVIMKAFRLNGIKDLFKLVMVSNFGIHVKSTQFNVFSDIIETGTIPFIGLLSLFYSWYTAVHQKRGTLSYRGGRCGIQNLRYVIIGRHFSTVPVRLIIYQSAVLIDPIVQLVILAKGSKALQSIELP